MTHDNSWPVALKSMSIGASNIHNKEQIVMTLDHDVQNKSESNLKKYRQIEQFAKKQGVDFYPAGSGIGHQIMVEQGCQSRAYFSHMALSLASKTVCPCRNSCLSRLCIFPMCLARHQHMLER